MKVLVTGLFEPAAVFVIRRLGELGHTVVAAEGHRLAYAAFSKHVSRRVRLPNMRHDPEGYAQAVLRELETGEYDAYFPSYEEIILMSYFRDRVLAATKTAMLDTQTLLTLHDKTRLDALARELGIDTPTTFAPKSMTEARELIADVRLPVVIKMRQTSGAAGFRKVVTRVDLEKQYADVVRVNKLPESDLPMIQELIEGPTTCTLHLCNAGSVVGEVMYQGVRTMPRTGGTTVCRESRPDPACQEAAARIVRHLGFHGFCGFDFVIQNGTGRAFLVDGNCRITPAVAMAYHGGCDMVEAWVRIVSGEDVQPLADNEERRAHEDGIRRLRLAPGELRRKLQGLAARARAAQDLVGRPEGSGRHCQPLRPDADRDVVGLHPHEPVQARLHELRLGAAVHLPQPVCGPWPRDRTMRSARLGRWRQRHLISAAPRARSRAGRG